MIDLFGWGKKDQNDLSNRFKNDAKNKDNEIKDIIKRDYQLMEQYKKLVSDVVFSFCKGTGWKIYGHFSGMLRFGVSADEQMKNDQKGIEGTFNGVGRMIYWDAWPVIPTEQALNAGQIFGCIRVLLRTSIIQPPVTSNDGWSVCNRVGVYVQTLRGGNFQTSDFLPLNQVTIETVTSLVERVFKNFH